MVNKFSDSAQVKRFFKTRGGKTLGIRGEEAQALAYAVLTSPCLDPSGNYPLPLKAIMGQTGLSKKALHVLFSDLHAVDFCRFDFQRQRVSVPIVAEIFSKLFTAHNTTY